MAGGVEGAAGGEIGGGGVEVGVAVVAQDVGALDLGQAVGAEAALEGLELLVGGVLDVLEAEVAGDGKGAAETGLAVLVSADLTLNSTSGGRSTVGVLGTFAWLSPFLTDAVYFLSKDSSGNYLSNANIVLDVGSSIYQLSSNNAAGLGVGQLVALTASIKVDGVACLAPIPLMGYGVPASSPGVPSPTATGTVLFDFNSFYS